MNNYFEEKNDSFNNDTKDFISLKKSIRFEKNNFGVNVFALVVHKDNDFNKIIELKTEYGEPLYPHVYDTVRDVYYLEGFDIFELGLIPFSFRIFVDDADWDCHIPFNFNIIKKYLDEDKKLKYLKWSKKFTKDLYFIKFIQYLNSM